MTPSATSSHLKGYQGQSPWLVSFAPCASIQDFPIQPRIIRRGRSFYSMEESVMHRLGNVLAACAIASSDCATERYASTGTAYLNPFAGGGDNVSYWDGDEVVGQSSIKIDLVHQRAKLPRGTDALLSQNPGRQRHARRLPARVSGITRLDSAAGANGSPIFPECGRRYSCKDH